MYILQWHWVFFGSVAPNERILTCFSCNLVQSICVDIWKGGATWADAILLFCSCAFLLLCFPALLLCFSALLPWCFGEDDTCSPFWETRQPTSDGGHGERYRQADSFITRAMRDSLPKIRVCIWRMHIYMHRYLYLRVGGQYDCGQNTSNSMWFLLKCIVFW